jgi:NADPH:quinone reductase-like Zn-dependent oxidoreductase
MVSLGASSLANPGRPRLGAAPRRKEILLKAICVTPSRELEVREVPTPSAPPPGHVVVDMESSAINHGDKTFLARPSAAGNPLAGTRHDVWGASGAGTIVAAGAGVPVGAVGRQVAIYRSLGRGPDLIGLWCERAQVPYTSCVILPDHVRARDYCGSLVNVITAYAFLEEIGAMGHAGVIATAGSSATGHALLALARRRGVPVIFLARSPAAREALLGLGAEHVLATSGADFEGELGALAEKLGATAVFDGVGGDLISRIAPGLPLSSTIYCYGFLAGAAPISLPSVVFMTKNLTMRRFSNFESATVKDPEKLSAALTALHGVIDDPLFRTRIGNEFGFDEIAAAMRYEATPGAKAVLVP